MTIDEIREKYPQYADMSDEDLARALHQRFYSDMDFGEFAGQIGLRSAPVVPQVEPSRVLEEGGIVSGAENISQLSFGEKILNDARILRDAAFGAVRGVPRGAAVTGGIVANPAGTVLNAVLPGDPFSTNVVSDVDRLMTDIGIPQVQTQAGRGMRDLSETGTAMYMGQAATARMFPQSIQQPVQSPRQQVLQQGQREGLVATPASTGSSRPASFLEGAAGTLKTRQLASSRNQEVANRLAARALGLSDDTVTPQAIQAIRQEAGKAYEVIRGAGTISTGQRFSNAVSSAISPIRSASSQSATIAKANSEILGIADDITSRQAYSADAVVDLIQMLRDNASAAYRNGLNTQGKAYRAMANAFEDAVEQTLNARGSAGRTILETFRNARQLIAKTHTVEDALQGSNIAVQRLANMVRRGKPLTDELRLLGQFGLEFPKSTALQQVSGSTPTYSPLDWWTALTSLGAAGVFQNPLLAVPALYSMGRPAIRNFVLSPAGQSMLRQNPATANPQVLGLIGGGIPQVSESN